LKTAFKNNAIEGKYLNKTKFNDIIMSLLNFNVPSLHYTYLSEKLYEMLDDSGDGKIQEDEFLNGMKKVLTNKEFRMKSIIHII
jgi:Ca2+-binding EF-hand superfamily protein